jgi:hypothetical protein
MLENLKIELYSVVNVWILPTAIHIEACLGRWSSHAFRPSQQLLPQSNINVSTYQRRLLYSLIRHCHRDLVPGSDVRTHTSAVLPSFCWLGYVEREPDEVQGY